MPSANRTLRGNKRRAVHDRLIVPKNGFQLPADPPRPIIEDLPDKPVGQRCTITHVIIYEMYVTYEGKPARKIHRIKFSDIVGNPVTEEKLEQGYDLVTQQGETITVKWHHNDGNWARSALILHNKKAAKTSYYEPNWGNVYGVGLEWISCDGTQSGTIWANRHLGNTSSTVNSDGTITININYFSSTAEPDHAPTAVRGGLMLGNPEPYRTMWLMGQELPIRVFPALGEIGRGCMFGFNPNVMNFVKVAPALPTWLRLTGQGTARGDAIGISWAKDEFHTLPVRPAIEVEMSPVVDRVNFPNAQEINGLYVFPMRVGKYRTGNVSGSTIFFHHRTEGECIVRIYLLETDDQGNPQYTLMKKQYHYYWGPTGKSCPVLEEEYTGTLPYPEKPMDTCAGVEPPSDVPDYSGTITDLGYFCNNSIDPDSIDQYYWNLPSLGVPENFWEGFNYIHKNLWGDNEFYINTGDKFYPYLWLLVMSSMSGDVDVPELAKDWQEFKSWAASAESGISCLNDFQKAMVYMSNNLGLPVLFYNRTGVDRYLQGNILDLMARYINETKPFAYEYLTFNQSHTDPSVGAYNFDPSYYYRQQNPEWDNYKSFINIEPEGMDFGDENFRLGSQIVKSMGIWLTDPAHPTDYIITQSGFTSPDIHPTNPIHRYQYDWWTGSLLQDYNDNFKAYVAAQIAVHEIGHAIDFFVIPYNNGKPLSDSAEWCDISGFDRTRPYDTSVPEITKSNPGNIADNGKLAPVSPYGTTHRFEDFAETFRMYVFRPDILRKYWRAKYDFMETYVKPMTMENVPLPAN